MKHAEPQGPTTPGVVTPSPEALSRYLVVSQVLVREREGLARSEATALVAASAHPTLEGNMRRRSERTLQRWVADFEADGIAGLEPTRRARIDGSMVLDDKLLSYLLAQKQADPRASVPELVRRARVIGLVGPEQRVDRTTVWRALRRKGQSTGRRKATRDRDTRRFAYPHRMDMVLCDGKHFRAGVHRAKRVALFFLDDATRLGLHVVVGTSESKVLFLRGLYELVCRWGLMSILYMDHGPGFIAHDTALVVQRLTALLLHGEKAYPEGHGKIERFNQTALGQVLRGLDRRPDVDADCGALELRLAHYLREIYNHTPHESLDNHTPWARFSADAKELRYPHDDESLRRRFVIQIERRVSADHVVSLDGTAYEMPTGHAGSKVILHCGALDGRVHVLHHGRMVRLHPVDLAHNAVERRARREQRDPEPVHPLPPSAADMAFERDLRPVVGSDGGFTDPTQEKT